MPVLCYIEVRGVKLKGAMLRKRGLGHASKNVLQGAAEWAPIFQKVIKNEQNKLQKKALYFRKILTI